MQNARNRSVKDDANRSELENIGVASIESDGTLHLRLRFGADGRSEAYQVYRKDHERYAEILAHIGEIEPGDFKPVRPWPSESNRG